jgi:hypothetical protein
MRLRPVVRRDYDDIINSFVRLHPDTVRALCAEVAQKSHRAAATPHHDRWPVGSAIAAYGTIAGAFPDDDDDDDDDFTLVDFLPLELTWRKRDDDGTVITRLYASYNGGTLSSDEDSGDENGT